VAARKRLPAVDIPPVGPTAGKGLSLSLTEELRPYVPALITALFVLALVAIMMSKEVNIYLNTR
jgi:hypothetical protein